ncbi:MAG: ABC transporter ATP-binding protein [Chloroflexi bacterium]|nr:MAG: ABC transporter ATP-binding protein [Chloroflexota bacterium]
MSELAIRIENLSKQYRIGQREAYKALRDVLADAVKRPVQALQSAIQRQPQPMAEPAMLWALDDVSFDINQGEVVGIVGRNGAGKSTLLKILSRITEPTVGRVALYGRVGSLLEVGTGFHPELTGRENIYLNGAILGMKRTEIERKFDEIVAFAEIERFLDTPVKRYSSGMYVRLAFAVAAHLEPEILIVDEVLAVGDAAFQEKCLGKMSSVAQQGRTILFVSHNMAAVQSLCGRAIWLHDGKMMEEGKPAQVISRYLQTSFTDATERVWDDPATAPGNERVRLRRATVRPLQGEPGDPITVRTPFVFEFEYWNLQPGVPLHLSLHLYNEQGILIFDVAPTDEPAWEKGAFPVGLFHDRCHVPEDLLNDGMYRLDVLALNDQTVIYKQSNVLGFTVHDSSELRGNWYGKWEGAIRPMLEWETDLVESAGQELRRSLAGQG